MSDVKYDLIRLLEEYFGEPDWESNGRNPKFILQQWEESFRSYQSQQLEDAARSYIRTSGKKTFPAIADIFDILEEKKSFKKVEKPIECHPAVLDDYKCFAVWHNKIVLGEDRPYPAVLTGDRQLIIKQHIAEFEKLHPEMLEQYNNQYRTVCGLAWREGWFVQCEKRMAELNEENKDKAVEFLRSLKKHSTNGMTQFGSIVGNVLLRNAPKDILDRL